MLDINKIKGYIKLKNLTQEKMAFEIGMSLGGFKEALRRGNFKASDLVKIGEVLEIHPGEFFSNSGGRYQKSLKNTYGDKIELLYQKIIDKETIINLLEDQLENYKNSSAYQSKKGTGT